MLLTPIRYGRLRRICTGLWPPLPWNACCSRNRPLAWRNDESGAWVSGQNRVENGSPIISAIGHKRGRRLVQFLQQRLDMRGVIDVFGGQIKCNDLPGAGVNANMKLSPSAAFGRAVLFKQLFASAAQFQSSAIDDQGARKTHGIHYFLTSGQSPSDRVR